MTKTITKDKTILVLAFAATFMAGAAVFGTFSDYEAEAKKPKKGALSIYINEETKTIPPFSFFINFAVGCDDGDELIGGGGRGADAGARVLVASQPVTDFNGENFWNVIFKDVPNTGGDVTGKAICVDTADPQHIP